jgi:hypothetical protein
MKPAGDGQPWLAVRVDLLHGVEATARLHGEERHGVELRQQRGGRVDCRLAYSSTVPVSLQRLLRRRVCLHIYLMRARCITWA